MAGSVILTVNLSSTKLLDACLATLTMWVPTMLNWSAAGPYESVYCAVYGVMVLLGTTVLCAAIETAGAARTATDVAARMSLRMER